MSENFIHNPEFIKKGKIDRAGIARVMRESRTKVVSEGLICPLEMTVGNYDVDPVEYFHVVICTIEEYDLVISQLEADIVTVEEAFRKSLVFPRIQPTWLDRFLGQPNAFYRNW